MNRLLITQVATGKRPDYDRVHAAVAEHQQWYRVGKSVWLLRTEGSDEEIADALKAFVPAGDGLFVLNVNRPATWLGLSP